MADDDEFEHAFVKQEQPVLEDIVVQIGSVREPVPAQDVTHVQVGLEEPIIPAAAAAAAATDATVAIEVGLCSWRFAYLDM
jgi:hypothetical protein